jgi:pyrroloquinoline quinone (PQQ) biosynthesis protein C
MHDDQALSAVKDLAKSVFASRPIEQHPMLVALQCGGLALPQVQHIALQIFHVVDHFPRLLSALATNMPDWRSRLTVVENLWEEHGRKDPALVHVETYKHFLASIGIDATRTAASRPSTPATAYNRALRDLCLNYPYAEGIGALGVVEEIVARASPIVARYAIAKQGVAKEKLVHFADHETLDVAHANEFYELAAPEMASSRDAVERGMRLGYYYHSRLYTDLHDECRQLA